MTTILYRGDCLEKMKLLKDKSIDIVLCDLPYGIFGKNKSTEWDKQIDLKMMWKQIWRISKPNTPVFLFGDFKFAVQLYNSQSKYWKLTFVWNKGKSTTPFLSKLRHGRATEYILMFYKKPPFYNYKEYHKVSKREKIYHNGSYVGAKKIKKQTNVYTPSLPINIIQCNNVRIKKLIKSITEKPQRVLEEFIKYYSREGDTVLDFTMGSCSCGVVCHKLRRNFIGIELNKTHFDISVERLKKINPDNVLVK